MNGITQEIPAVQVVNVNSVSVEPPRRPGVKHVEPKPTVLKSSPAVCELGTVHVKGVAAAKTGAELRFRNAPMARGWPGSPTGLLMLRRLGLLLIAAPVAFAAPA